MPNTYIDATFFICLRKVKFIFKTFRLTKYCGACEMPRAFSFWGWKYFFTYILVKESNFEAEKFRKLENKLVLQLCFLVWPNFCRTLSHILQGLPLG